MADTENKYVCEKCNFKVNTKTRWEAHLKTELHINGKRKKRSDFKEAIKCDKCDYSSKNGTMVKTHILNNHKTKEEREKEFKYYCTYCDFGTFAIKSRDIHEKTEKHTHSKSLFELVK